MSARLILALPVPTIAGLVTEVIVRSMVSVPSTSLSSITGSVTVAEVCPSWIITVPACVFV